MVPHQAPEGEGSEQPTELQPTPSPTQPSGPTSDRAEGGMTLDELYVLCTNLSNKVLALEASKDAQAAEIIKLKTRIKKLKKKKGRQSNETEEFNKGSGKKEGSTEGPVTTDVPKTV
ncbi:hypothetical protein Tco_0229423, partial [Tanacetum coccineum]